MRIFALLLLFMYAHSVSAVDDDHPVLPVWVSAQCGTDDVASQLMFSIREAIRASSGYSLASTGQKPALMLTIICMPRSSPVGVDYASTLTMPNPAGGKRALLLTASIESCPAKETDECAKSLLASIDEEVLKIRTGQ